jgi:nitrogen fixation protein
MFKNEFLNFQDKLYIIKKIIREDLNPVIDVWKEHLRADIVLRRDGWLYFLELVQDLEIIKDENI